MTNKKRTLRKWVLIGVLAAAAGTFYCCGSTGTNRVTFTKEDSEDTIREGTVTADALAKDIAGADAVSRAVSGETELPENGEDTPVSSAAASAEKGVCYVYVCGEVLDPGVYQLSEGQRVYEAIELAGGFTSEAAQNYWNLAQPVTDGMKIEVPDLTQAASLPAETITDTTTVRADSDKVNINTADREQLMTLTGIGEARAEAIIAYRVEHGSFRSIEDIMNVSGIKEAAFQKIKEKITV